MTPGLTAATPSAKSCRLHFRKILANASLTALNKLFSRLENPSILGGNCASGQTQGYSYWMSSPVEMFEFRDSDRDPFKKLHRTLNKYKLTKKADTLPKRIFCGGWVGFLGYELGRYIEKLPKLTIDDIKLPLIRLCFYDSVICYDHAENAFLLIALELPGDTECPSEKLASMQQLLLEAENTPATSNESAEINGLDSLPVECNMTEQSYFDAVAKIKKLIFDGDVYQVNFSQRFRCDFSGQPIDLFNWHSRSNPCPYAAYIDAGDFQVVSTSPEMFIHVTDCVISTKPIKGTRPRLDAGLCEAAAINDCNFRELTASEKEQAELNMIIDLERNDLTKICQYGSIKVTQPRTIETYPTVFHAVSTVEGRLRPDVSFCDILKAMFPGGSITGAPKLAAMETIEKLELTARGIYTGSIGFLGLDGTISLNIAIRTVIIKDGKAYIQTGGGIVADSEPGSELQETFTKADALIKGVKSTGAGKVQYG